MALAESDLEAPAPSLLRLAREATGLLELPGLAWRARGLLDQPRGDGSSVVVLPGFGADDRSTWPLRTYLSRLGYRVRGWGLGRNDRDVPETAERMGEVVGELADRHGDAVSLVGWSLGGYIAREVARDRPEAVRQVITFGSPVIGGPKYTTAAVLASRRGWDLDGIAAAVAERKRVPLEVPITAIYSRRDGVVDWRACIDDEGGGPIEHVEVRATHVGLGFSAEVYRLVAQRLARTDRETRGASLR